jgi:hypothetical protein
MRKEQLVALTGQFGTVDDVEEKRWIVIVIIFLLAGKSIHGGMRGIFVYGTATWLRCQVDHTPPETQKWTVAPLEEYNKWNGLSTRF